MDLSDSAVIQLRGRQIDQFYARAPTDAAIGAIAVVLATVASTGVAPMAITGIWMLVMVTICGARFLLAVAYRKLSVGDAGITRWLMYGTAGAIATGAAWGAFAGYMVLLPNVTRAAEVLFLVCALALVSVVTCAGSMAAAVGFAVCALVPPAAGLLLRADAIGFNGALMLGIVIAMTAGGARGMKRMLLETIALQNEYTQLTGHLDQRRNQIERLNVALKTNEDKRELAEQNLRRTAADLGLVQGKAKALAETLERVSPLCQVTGLPNRRSFDQHVDSEWRRAIRDVRPVSLVVIGIDDYDEYLEKYGRQSTDSLLKKVALTVKGFGRRAGDVAGRYEESSFGLVLQNCDGRNAVRIAEALRKRVEGHKIAQVGSRARDVVTIHIGVATMTPARSLEPDQIYKRVEIALYEAQFQGGNRVVMYKPLSKIRLERWDTQNDGQLNDQSMTQKLLVWGYDTQRTIMPPGTSVPAEVSDRERVIAIVTGELKITIEGHSMVIKPGDSVFVPPAIVMQLDVAGKHPVIRYTAIKAS